MQNGEPVVDAPEAAICIRRVIRDHTNLERWNSRAMGETACSFAEQAPRELASPSERRLARMQRLHNLGPGFVRDDRPSSM